MVFLGEEYFYNKVVGDFVFPGAFYEVSRSLSSFQAGFEVRRLDLLAMRCVGFPLLITSGLQGRGWMINDHST